MHKFLFLYLNGKIKKSSITNGAQIRNLLLSFFLREYIALPVVKAVSFNCFRLSELSLAHYSWFSICIQLTKHGFIMGRKKKQHSLHSKWWLASTQFTTFFPIFTLTRRESMCTLTSEQKLHCCFTFHMYIKRM